MLVLSLAEVEAGASPKVSDLIAEYTRAHPVSDLQCSQCSQAKQDGEVNLEFVGDPPETIFIRLNRSNGQDCSVIPDGSLTLWGSSYSLRAILLHQGYNCDRGRFLMYIRNFRRWEYRSDGTCVPCANNIPVYNGREVYVLVYKKVAVAKIPEDIGMELVQQQSDEGEVSNAAKIQDLHDRRRAEERDKTTEYILRKSRRAEEARNAERLKQATDMEQETAIGIELSAAKITNRAVPYTIPNNQTCSGNWSCSDRERRYRARQFIVR